MKKILVLILMGIMIFSFAAFAEESTTEEVVSEDSISGEALQELGLIEGNGNGLNENGVITREALVKMLVSLTTDLTADFELPETPSFSDVPAEHWAYSWVERAFAANLTKGVGGGKFGIGQNVTKQQVSAFMLNALNEEYNYSTAIESATEKGITSEVVESFNRGNSFEMVQKTLLQKPVGQERALYALTNNFKGKNFKQILANIELRRDEAKKVAEAIAAEKAEKEAAEALIIAEKAAAELLIKNEKTMEKYRGTWPTNLEDYQTWMTEMAEIMAPQWQTSTVEALYKDYYNFNFMDIIASSNYTRINVKSNSIYVEYISATDQSISDSYFFQDVKIYYIDAYKAYKIEGTYGGIAHTVLLVKDSNVDYHKGYFFLGDKMQITSAGGHPFSTSAWKVERELVEKQVDQEFKTISRSKLDELLNEDIVFGVLVRARHESPTMVRIEAAGIDEYTFNFKSINFKNNKAYITMTKKSDDSPSEFEITSMKLLEDGSLLELRFLDEDKMSSSLLIEFDESNNIIKGFVKYKSNTGSYVKE